MKNKKCGCNPCDDNCPIVICKEGKQGLRGFRGPMGPTGIQGPTGATGPYQIQSTYIVSYNNNPGTFPANGLEIASGERLPLMRKEADYGEIITLDSTDNTIQFNETGVYSIIFTANAYVPRTATDFNQKTDFVSIGFREVNSDQVIASANTWSYNEAPTNLTGHGIVVITDIATPYEFVNLQKKSIFVNGADITETISNSYFGSELLTVSITKLSPQS
ncbi:MAG: collagen-like protein [Clostridiales bacterium]|nr:collagen-like protein [Candidatus Apopatousia equi]